MLWGVAKCSEACEESRELKGRCEGTDFSNLGTGTRWAEAVKMSSDIVSGTFFCLYFCSWDDKTT